ncbi:M10 family metallopeptidase C-terminal domain-containing protein [Mesorhizobium sangaii]|uniref:Ca2+-binding RTX toxin-like protein n=1 Tax=Mesorhizobium sangaii TaxID=505389 RepID=A0A841PF20_9HYPH|nr:M10 family metallopeptidase C-terminal domain-containing protein [Mesorhizobium sangaii]MBB6411268.1 Ca2+-binding RTX toxin-like protein [Mesorhizobium sangaii]
MPNVTETTDAASSIATSYTLAVGQTATGHLSSAGDHDWYRVHLVAGQTYTFAEVGEGARVSPTVGDNVEDTFMALMNASGTLVASNDDVIPGQYRYSTITYTALTTGDYFINAGAYNDDYVGQYGVSVVSGTRASYDELMGAGAILRPGSSWSTAPGQPVNVTWAVRMTDVNCTDSQGDAAPFSPLSSAEIAAVKSVLAMYSSVCGVTFTQVNPAGTSNNATMLFGNYTSTADPAGAYAVYPGTTAPGDISGDVHLNTDAVATGNLPIGSYDYQTILHETGHALGLSHPGEYNAGSHPTYGNDAQFIQDSNQYSVMSYFDETNTGASDYNDYPDTLMLYDILAVQQLYGANMTTRTGNTVYGFGSNAGNVYNFALNPSPAICIWDAGGVDTLDASGFGQAQTINLAAGSFSDIGGGHRNVSIAFGASIENAVGGSGIDTLIGNSGNNVLDGKGGGDTMRGGVGNDTYYVDNAGDHVIEANGQGTDNVQAYVSFNLSGQALENLALRSAASINGTGNSAANIITGNSGNNVIDGLAGADTMSGSTGNDTYYVDNAGDHVTELNGQGTDGVFSSVSFNLSGQELEKLTLTGAGNIDGTGNSAANIINGNSGNNIIDGLGGADTMSGSTGNDTYYVDNAGDHVVELNGQGTDGVFSSVSFNLSGQELEKLTLTGSGNINGTGNSIANIITGNSGNNIIDGLAGADTMSGAQGNDTYYVDNAGDHVVELNGQGTDNVQAYVSFNLSGQELENLALRSTGNINGIGNSTANIISGNSGANVINGLGGNDTLSGSTGNDSFVFTTALNASTNVDHITDFSVADDTIQVDNAIFAALGGNGTLTADQFAANALGAATNADQHIIYETDTGWLYYDSDGSAVGSSTHFATLTANLALTNADFVVV